MSGRSTLALTKRLVLDWGMKKPSRRPCAAQPEAAPRHRAGAHATHKLRYHVVLIPKYRKRVLRGAAPDSEVLIRLAHEVCPGGRYCVPTAGRRSGWRSISAMRGC